MTSDEIRVGEEREIAAPPPLVWALAADSNRWDRLTGFGPTTYQHPEAPGASIGPVRIGESSLKGMAVSWIERGEWVEGRFFQGERRFLSGPFVLGVVRSEVEPSPRGTRIRAASWVVPRSPLPDDAAEALRKGLLRALSRYLDAVARVLDGAGAAQLDGWPGRSAAAAARRLLADRAHEEALSGRPTIIAPDHLDYCTAQLLELSPDPDIARRVADHVRTRSDEEVQDMRPYELALAWDLPPRRVLRTFLHGTRAGLLELDWLLDCPACRVAADSAPGLSSVGGKAHCVECGIDFQLDFSRNVEAVFRASRSVRPAASIVYCAGSPWLHPHVLARLEVPPGSVRSFAAPLPDGPLLVRAFRCDPPAEVVDAWGDLLLVRVTDAGLEAVRHEDPDAGGGRIVVENGRTTEVSVHVERWSTELPPVTGAELATLTEFHDLFGTEAPATGAEISVGSMTLLFSDLTGATALFQHLGDARAFALVERHFAAMGGIVDAHEGAVVKTMGDAIMAAFRSPDAALAAAIEMVRGTRVESQEGKVRLRVGLHAGPCLAVRANGRLDFFGTTVNLAARLQALAAPDQVVVLAGLLDHPGVARVLGAASLAVARGHVELKGIRDAQQVAAITV